MKENFYVDTVKKLNDFQSLVESVLYSLDKESKEKLGKYFNDIFLIAKDCLKLPVIDVFDLDKAIEDLDLKDEEKQKVSRKIVPEVRELLIENLGPIIKMASKRDDIKVLSTEANQNLVILLFNIIDSLMLYLNEADGHSKGHTISIIHRGMLEMGVALGSKEELKEELTEGYKYKLALVKVREE